MHQAVGAGPARPVTTARPAMTYRLSTVILPGCCRRPPEHEVPLADSAAPADPHAVLRTQDVDLVRDSRLVLREITFTQAGEHWACSGRTAPARAPRFRFSWPAPRRALTDASQARGPAVKNKPPEAH